MMIQPMLIQPMMVLIDIYKKNIMNEQIDFKLETKLDNTIKK